MWEYIRVNVHALVVEELQVAEYLHFKEELVDGRYFLFKFFEIIIMDLD